MTIDAAKYRALCDEVERLAMELRCAQIQVEDRGRSYQEVAAQLAAMTGERDDEIKISQGHENRADDLETKLAAMTAARDELADIACDYTMLAEDDDRVLRLRSVGKETP